MNRIAKQAARGIAVTARHAWKPIALVSILVPIGGSTGCSSNVSNDEADAVGASSQPLTSVGTIFDRGMKLQFDKMNATNLDLQKTVGLTACDSKAIYAVRKDTSAYTILFSN